ncbi:hypothetical protein [Dyadobacter sediminis]|uniref:Uncharacterized protein n=1 Tax=Dyadobacter sediminis TaxID=1493691 RepID=A0A5R9KF57_9BACT|nr:hypothetical protein [Dyadobacter sediminis]TLU94688.1 hypothetical protein FEM55_10710 [Dyadobacter sediminis]GGB89026.1 hypothetical protein GCM10011325_15670 [Dyadobacter sediminis]
MENTHSPLEDYKNFGLTPESGRNDELLSDMLRKKETVKNLNKLAENLNAKWSTSKATPKKPDLSFAAFEKKLKEARNQ